MASVIATAPVSTEEFLNIEASAADNVELALINGEIREYPMTTRSPKHSTAVTRVSHELAAWLDEHPERDGEVASGETRCRIARNPDTTVGLDVAYFEETGIGATPSGAEFFDGAPVIAVEVLSPSDTHENVSERIRTLLAAGARQVWVADPDFRTVTVHRPNAEPQFFAAGATLTAGPELEGFECRVERLFGRVRSGSTT